MLSAKLSKSALAKKNLFRFNVCVYADEIYTNLKIRKGRNYHDCI